MQGYWDAEIHSWSLLGTCHASFFFNSASSDWGHDFHTLVTDSCLQPHSAPMELSSRKCDVPPCTKSMCALFDNTALGTLTGESVMVQVVKAPCDSVKCNLQPWYGNSRENAVNRCGERTKVCPKEYQGMFGRPSFYKLPTVVFTIYFRQRIA